jgi:hypothetical protein
MTAVPPENADPELDRQIAAQFEGGAALSTDVPRIRLVSWPGLESVAWGAVIAHLVKWAVSFGYFASFQVRYLAPQYGPPQPPFVFFYLKDWWDRLPVHVENLLGASWFIGQQAPQWWVTWRHDIRDVGIAVIATIIVRLLFAKPKYPAGDHPGWGVYLTRIPLAIGAALVPIALIGVAAWQLPWLLQHGLTVPARYGALAPEVNGWVAAGTWITVAMGIAGGLVASRIMQRVADDVQWFFAERSAAKIRDESRLTLTQGRVIGTPAHRKRVRWLLANEPELPARSPWLVRALLVAAFFAIAFAGAGAWLNLAGPAAPH